MNKRIIVTGFPYAFPYYRKMLDFLKNKEEVQLILPKVWEAKNGVLRFVAPKEYGISSRKAFSFGGHGFRGLLKGWMPGLVVDLAHFRLTGASVLYSCSEPQLLTTLYNGLFAKLFGFRHILFTWQNVPPVERIKGPKLLISDWIVRANLALADGIICGNHKAAGIVRKYDHEIPTLVCPLSGVDTDRFKPGPRTEWFKRHGINANKIILFYGALDNRKGVGHLIRAFSKIADKEAALVIAGTGPLKAHLEEIAQEIRARVHFIDWIPNPELPEVLRGADIFVYPSVPYGGWEEQFGYAMAEASACGLPVVATDTGSIDEIVRDHQTGLLVPPKDEPALLKAIDYLLNNEDIANKFGATGREYILKKYSQAHVAGEIGRFLVGFKKNPGKESRAYWHDRFIYFRDRTILRKPASILMYHSVGHNGESFTVTPEAFRSQMRYLKINGYKVMSLQDLISAHTSGKIPDRAVAITFDDGYEDNFTEAFPILREFGLSATIFLVTGLVGGVRTNKLGVSFPMLSWKQIEMMHQSGLISFGGHTVNHVRLSSIDEHQINREIYKSFEDIGEHLSDSSKIFAYPWGLHPFAAQAVLRNMNAAAVTVERGFIDAQTDPCLLPRNSVNTYTSMRRFPYLLP